MSKLDPTGESLESILASIRRGLAEQSTDILVDDDTPQPVSLDSLGAVVPGEDAPPRFLGGGGPEVPQPNVLLPSEVPLPAGFPTPTDRAFAGLDDPPPPASISAALSRLAEEPAPVAPPTEVLRPPQREEAKDPLWFLARGKDKDGIPAPQPQPPAAAQQAPIQAAPVHPASPTPVQPIPATVVPPRAAAPKPALNDIVRGPLPPFFGSSPEAANVEVAPPMPAPLPTVLARPAETEPAPGHLPDSLPRPPVAPVGGAVLPVTAAMPAAGAGPAAREAALPNGKAQSFPLPPASGSAAPPAFGSPSGAGPHLQGLEAMVAELLRPMLRQWLDENMPRLVSAALKAEAESPPRRDPKKP